MVSKEQIVELMARYFPKCPICGSSDGWEASGTVVKCVQCKSCGAKWASKDFIKCEKLKELELWEASKDERGLDLLHKTHPTEFWQQLEPEDEITIDKRKLFLHEDMNDADIENAIKRYQARAIRFSKTLGATPILLAAIRGVPVIESTKAMLLASIVETNKIIILQNELILRSLKKLNK